MLKEKRIVLLALIMLAVASSGCILSKTPSTNDVSMTLGEQMTFSVNVFPSNATYAWTLDEVTISNTDKSYVYTAEAGKHTLVVKAKHILVTDTQTWNITVSSYDIGDTGPAGGWIFYDKGSYSDGWRYLEAAPSDQTTDQKIQWYNGSNIETEATGTEVGTGKTNTTLIVNAQGDGSYAAKLCDDLSITNNGVVYDDWFLPSIDELYLMYQNLYVPGISGFVVVDDYYWSSSEEVSGDGPLYAQILYFNGSGTIGWTSKSALLPVRAARAF